MEGKERLYKREWEEKAEYKDWLSEDPNDPDRAFCKICKQSVPCATITDIHLHAISFVHKANLKADEAPSLSFGIEKSTFQPKPQRTKITPHVNSQIFELRLLLCAVLCKAKHEHFINIFNDIIKTSYLNKSVDLHRTKCVKALSLVGETVKEELIADIGDQPYSLIVEEFDRLDNSPCHCICVRYFSNSKMRIVNCFFGLLDMTSQCLTLTSAIDFFTSLGLELKNLIGFSTDSHSPKSHVFNIKRNLEWFTNSLSIQLLPHSLKLCIASASCRLPSKLLSTWVNIYNYLLQDGQQSYYTTFFAKVDIKRRIKNGFQNHKNSWLDGTDVIKAIIKHWSKLKIFFGMNFRKEDYLRWTIRNMFHNEIYLYYIIIDSILSKVNRVNEDLQKLETDIVKIYPDLYQLLIDCMKIIIKPQEMQGLEFMSKSNFDKISEILGRDTSLIQQNLLDYGLKFNEAKARFPVLDDALLHIQRVCQQFILDFCKELIQRFPTNFEVCELLRTLSVQIALDKQSRPTFESLPVTLIGIDETTNLKDQWENLPDINFSTFSLTGSFGLIPFTSSEKFWCHVKQHHDKHSIHTFSKIAEFALKTLSLPSTNSEIERVFSFTKLLLSKTHKNIPLEVLEAVIRIKHPFEQKQFTCQSFVPSNNLTQKLNSFKCSGLCDNGYQILKSFQSVNM